MFKFKLNNAVFWPPLIGLLFIVILSFINDKAFGAVVNGAVMFLFKYLGWTIGPVTLIMMIVMAILFVHPASKLKFGGKDAVPEYKFWSWFAMTLCCSIAIGIVFWGCAEPIYHFSSPAASWGIEAFSDAAAVNALAVANTHWSFAQYTYYAIFAILIGIAAFNYKQPFMVSSGFYFLRNKPLGKVGSKLIDIFCLFGIIGGVACSIGTGTMQFGAGLNTIFGVPINKMTWFLCLCFIVAAFSISTARGIEKGIKVLGNVNFWTYNVVMVALFVLGPTVYILNLGTESIGNMFQNLFTRLTFTGGVTGDTWPVFWTMWMYVSVAAFAPIIGMFMARVAYGRTVREVLICYWIAPSIFNIIWFNIFGGSAIYMQKTGQFDLWNAIQNSGLEASLFKFFPAFPNGGTILMWLFFAAMVISFVTFADSMTTAIAIMTTDTATDVLGNGEPPMLVKVVWASLMGLTGYVFIAFSGISGAKSIAIIAGFPIMVLVVMGIYCLYKLFIKESAKDSDMMLGGTIKDPNMITEGALKEA